MTREIKFRAWDDDLKLMMTEVDLSQPLRHYKWLGRADLPLMQFTGLKDKNGKEIYEGDVVRCTHSDYDEDVSVVEFRKGGFCVYVPCGDSEENTIGYAVTFDWFFEIIGNIYENKDLLT